MEIKKVAVLGAGIMGVVWHVLGSLDNQMWQVYHKACCASCMKTASLRIEMGSPG
jgi:hypothetical protein